MAQRAPSKTSNAPPHRPAHRRALHAEPRRRWRAAPRASRSLRPTTASPSPSSPTVPVRTGSAPRPAPCACQKCSFDAEPRTAHLSRACHPPRSLYVGAQLPSSSGYKSPPTSPRSARRVQLLAFPLLAPCPPPPSPAPPASPNPPVPPCCLYSPAPHARRRGGGWMGGRGGGAGARAADDLLVAGAGPHRQPDGLHRHLGQASRYQRELEL